MGDGTWPGAGSLGVSGRVASGRGPGRGRTGRRTACHGVAEARGVRRGASSARGEAESPLRLAALRTLRTAAPADLARGGRPAGRAAPGLVPPLLPGPVAAPRLSAPRPVLLPPGARLAAGLRAHVAAVRPARLAGPAPGGAPPGRRLGRGRRPDDVVASGAAPRPGPPGGWPRRGTARRRSPGAAPRRACRACGAGRRRRGRTGRAGCRPGPGRGRAGSRPRRRGRPGTARPVPGAPGAARTSIGLGRRVAVRGRGDAHRAGEPEVVEGERDHEGDRQRGGAGGHPAEDAALGADREARGVERADPAGDEPPVGQQVRVGEAAHHPHPQRLGQHGLRQQAEHLGLAAAQLGGDARRIAARPRRRTGSSPAAGRCR